MRLPGTDLKVEIVLPIVFYKGPLNFGILNPIAPALSAARRQPGCPLETRFSCVDVRSLRFILRSCVFVDPVSPSCSECGTCLAAGPLRQGFCLASFRKSSPAK